MFQNPKQGAHGAVSTRIPTQTSKSKPATNTVFRMASCRLRAKAIIFFMALIITVRQQSDIKKARVFRPCLHRIFHTMLCRRCRRRWQYRHFDDTATLAREHTIYPHEVAPAKTADRYTLHACFTQTFQRGFGSFEMLETTVTLGSGIVIYVYHILFLLH
nr:MAG TPA: hypothetical protein [Caudoviricetes sp.]